MPKIGIDLKQLTREELEEYTYALEMFASKCDNPIAHTLLIRDYLDVSHKKRCEIFHQIPSSDNKGSNAIIDFLWQKIKSQLM